MVNPKEIEFENFPHIAPGNIESFTGKVLDNVKQVKDENLISGKFRFRPNDIIYGKINPQLGKYTYASVDGLTSADAYVLKSKNNLEQIFLYQLIQTNNFYNYSVMVSRRSGMPKINRQELSFFNFLAPSNNEQIEIGNLLMEIEKIITLHQRESKFYFEEVNVCQWSIVMMSFFTVITRDGLQFIRRELSEMLR